MQNWGGGGGGVGMRDEVIMGDVQLAYSKTLDSTVFIDLLIYLSQLHE